MSRELIDRYGLDWNSLFARNPGGISDIHRIHAGGYNYSCLEPDISHPVFRLHGQPNLSSSNVAAPVPASERRYARVLPADTLFLSFGLCPHVHPHLFSLERRIHKPFRGRITTKDFWFYLPLAVAVGFSLGWGEHNVLHAETLVPGYGMMYILVLVIIMIGFVGFVEEFVFRSALQTVMEERIGSVAGLLATSVIFGFMHSGYHLPLEILFVSFAGVVFGLLFWMTRSLPVIALAHGITNISLFLVAPVHSDYIPYLIGVPLLLFFLLAYLNRGSPNRMDLKRIVSGPRKKTAPPLLEKKDT